MHRFLSFIALTTLLGCRHSLHLTTAPEGAQVTAMDSAGQPGRVLGQTPLELDGLLAEGELGLIQMQKPGFEPKQLVLPAIGSGDALRLHVVLDKKDDARLRREIQEVSPAVLDKAVRDSLKLQTKLVQRDLAGAAKLADQLIADYPKLSTAQFLVGHMHFLNGDSDKAREFYTRALELDPTNREAGGMLQTLKGGKP